MSKSTETCSHPEKNHYCLVRSPTAVEPGRRNAGRELTLREHTWEMRFEKIFGLMGIVE